MKIALISHLFPTDLYPFHGKFIKDQLLLLNSDADIEADLVVPTPYSFPFTSRNQRSTSALLADEFKNTRISYLSFPRKKFPRIIQNSLSKAVENEFRDKKYDVIHVHWVYPDGMAIPKLKAMGFKCVLTIHGSDWEKSCQNPLLLSFFEGVFQAVDHIFFVGEQLRQSVLKRFPFIEDKSSISYNFIDENIYIIPTEEEKYQARKNLRWDTNKMHFLTVGRLAPEKGIDLLIKSVKLGKNQLSSVEFHVVGTEEHCSDLPPNLYLQPGVPPEKLIQYYYAADAYISPSRKEGFGLSMIEAASCGLPVVATPAGVASSFVNKITGIKTDGFNYTEICQAIINMSETIENYDKRLIRKAAISKFNSKKYLDYIKSNYIKIM